MQLFWLFLNFFLILTPFTRSQHKQEASIDWLQETEQSPKEKKKKKRRRGESIGFNQETKNNPRKKKRKRKEEEEKKRAYGIPGFKERATVAAQRYRRREELRSITLAHGGALIGADAWTSSIVDDCRRTPSIRLSPPSLSSLFY
uniref:Uncharacterized protein n=1 Tax=Davidia involucrata TaxID=16924 RepID=A0A5B7C8M2_DAVIN